MEEMHDLMKTLSIRISISTFTDTAPAGRSSAFASEEAKQEDNDDDAH